MDPCNREPKACDKHSPLIIIMKEIPTEACTLQSTVTACHALGPTVWLGMPD